MKKKYAIIFSFIVVMTVVFAGMAAVMARPSGIIGLLDAMREYYEGYFYIMAGVAFLILFLEKRISKSSIAQKVLLETLAVIATVIGTYCVDKIPLWGLLESVPYAIIFFIKMVLSLLLAWGCGKLGVFFAEIDCHVPKLWDRWKWFFIFSILTSSEIFP